jgi:hypothetical protein
MNNSYESTQPQAEATQTQVESKNPKKFGRVAAIGGLMLAGAAVLTVAVPEGNAQSPAETNMTQIDSTPQEVIPGTELRLKPNPRREAAEKPAEPAQEQTTDVTTEPVSEPAHESEHQDKPKKDKHEIGLINDTVVPQISDAPSTPEPTPIIVEVTPDPLPPPENPDPINQ